MSPEGAGVLTATGEAVSSDSAAASDSSLTLNDKQTTGIFHEKWSVSSRGERNRVFLKGCISQRMRFSKQGCFSNKVEKRKEILEDLWLLVCDDL